MSITNIPEKKETLTYKQLTSAARKAKIFYVKSGEAYVKTSYSYILQTAIDCREIDIRTDGYRLYVDGLYIRPR